MISVSNLWQRHFSWLVLATLVAGLGAGALLAGLIQSTPARSSQTSQGLPPLTAPGTGTTGAANSATASQSAAGTGGTGVMGTIASIDSNIATVRGQQGEVRVKLESAKIVKTTDGTAEDLKAGQQVTAMALQEADGGYTASSIQIESGDQARRGVVLQGQGSGGGNAARGQGQQNSPEGRTRAISGTIAGIDSGVATISTGQEEVKLKISGARIQKSVEGTIQDLQSGQRVLISGSQDSEGSYASAEIQILAAAGQQPGSGPSRQGQ